MKKTLISMACIALLAACNSSDDDGDSGGDSGGEIVTANSWEILDVDGPTCGNGSEVNMAIDVAAENSAEPTDTLVLFLQGGGACWDLATCANDGTGNSAGAAFVHTTLADSDVLAQAAGTSLAGILAREDELNPFRHDNLAYVPYCTGDIHSGAGGYTVVGGTELEPELVYHTGGTNLQSYLLGDGTNAGLVDTFSDVEEVFLVGASAGGFGTILMHQLVQDAFGETPVHMLTDGGMPLSASADATNALENNPTDATYDLTQTDYDAYWDGFAAATGLPESSRTVGRTIADGQSALIDTWGSSALLPTDDSDVVIEDLALVFADNLAENDSVRYAAVTSLDDQTIQSFMDTMIYQLYSTFAMAVGLETGLTYSVSDWETAINDVESLLDGLGESTHYFVKDDSTHVYFNSDLSVTADGVALSDWLAAFRSGEGWSSVSEAPGLIIE